MHLPLNLLDRPAEETARLIALAFLDQADRSRKRLARLEPEALHDFRVGIRRLRTTLRSYQRELAGSISARTARQLKRLARATGASRDLEVRLEWARGRMEEMGPRQQAGVSWLVDRLERRKKKADRRLERAIDQRWRSVRRRLRRELSSYRLKVRVDRIARGHIAAPAVGRLIQQLAGDVESRLTGIHSIAQRDAAHRARIQVKRLRYMMEPIQGQAENVGPMIRGLKVLQDLLGDLHDAQGFMAELDRCRDKAAVEQLKALTRRRGWRTQPGRAGDSADADPRPGLVALNRSLTERNRTAFQQLDAEWLGGAAEEFFAGVSELAQSLIQGDRHQREIERKYLLRSIPPAARVAPALRIEQGWLPGQRIAERVRRVQDGGQEHRFRTIKAGTGLSRLEVEEELAPSLFDHLWPLTEGRRVVKQRHRVNDCGLVWEIDDFTDRQLVLAEVELPSEETPVNPPEWLQPYVIREVTGEDEYVNLNLAK
jgi:CHAD domain-containing protein/CYTH domain-containing protein